MTRCKRVDYPGAWLHLMNRGLAKRPIFESRREMRAYLACLAMAVRRHELEVHAYCLMTNHFHILGRSLHGQIWRGMKRVENDYVRWFNRRHHRDGSLFRGRFVSKEVQSLRYRQLLVRYIDYNPVEARIVGRPEDYEFCGAAHFASGRLPPWLATWWIAEDLAEFTRQGLDLRQAYRAGFSRPLSADESYLVDRRIRCAVATDHDPLDDLLASAPHAVRSWLERKTMLADGSQPGLPIASPEAVEATLRQHAPDRWPVYLRNRTLDGRRLAHAFLLREMCGLTMAEVAARLETSPTTVHNHLRAHAEAFERDAYHRDLTSRLASAALIRATAR